jgi:hypothetical protein
LLKRYLLWIFCALLWGCKTASPQASRNSDPIVGAWELDTGSPQQCTPLGPYYTKTTMTVRSENGLYVYDLLYRLFADVHCLRTLLEEKVAGSWQIAEAAPSEKLPTRGLYHTRHKAEVQILDYDFLQRANLKTDQGLQKSTRLCKREDDWEWGKSFSVLGLSCGLNLITTPLDAALNIVQIQTTPYRLILGQDQATGEFSRTYVRLMEQKATMWSRAL